MADNFELRMNFVIEQQVQFTVDIQLLKERQAETARLVEANREMIHQSVDVTMSLAPHAEDTDRRLGELGAHTEERIRELAEAGADTEHRMNALVDTVDKPVRRNDS